MLKNKADIISQLQKDILRLQGCNMPQMAGVLSFSLNDIEAAFPNAIFPTATIHEFLTFEPECKAATSGFLSGLLNKLMQNGGICIWIGTHRNVYPLSLKVFGVEPDKVIFIDLKRERDILWTAEEALKCGGISAVVAELNEMSFTQSRRLQLAVEKSKVTGFVLRTDPLKLTTSTCAARWQITSLPSSLDDGMPGVGFPKWNVELLRVRNGNPGIWQVEWRADQFVPVIKTVTEEQLLETNRKAG